MKRSFALYAFLKLPKRVLCATLLVLTVTAGRCAPMDKALRAYGYTPLTPPSRLMTPGTLVWVSDTSPFIAGVLCSTERVMGAGWQPAESPTMNSEIAKTAKRGINFKIDASTFVTAQMDLSTVKDVSLSLKNARIYEIDDFAVQERDNTMDRRCLRAMERRARAGFKTTMISSALMADATYHVRWATDANVSVQAKIAHLEAVAAQLGLGNSTVTDKTITAEGLVLGVKTDDWLAYLYSPENLAMADKRQSLMLPDWEGTVIDKEDSVSTTSSSDMPTLADSTVEQDYWSTVEISDPE